MTTFRSRQRANQRRDMPQQHKVKPIIAESASADTGRTTLSLFAPCPRGLEAVLTDELNELGAVNLQAVNGGVAFQGGPLVMMRANLMCRIATRILLEVKKGPYRNERDINGLAMQVNWPRRFDVNRTIKVKTEAINSPLKSVDYISLTVKDAICDRFRQAQLGRPTVDTRHPDIRIHVFLTQNTATFYLDTSGPALFKRGWRNRTSAAPLRENLAAGILMLAGYTGTQPLIDPMCGGGTLLIEAADIALKRAPGRLREFAFQKFKDFDAPNWELIKNEAQQRELPPRVLPIYGSDLSAQMVRVAADALAQTGLTDVVTLQQKNIVDVRRIAERGLIITNPPYGIRMEKQQTLSTLYPQLGTWLTHYFGGWSAYFFTADPHFAEQIPLTIERRIPLFNGALNCHLLVLSIN